MSVVVLCDGVLAADSRAYGGHGQPSPGSKAKIHRLDDGRRVGLVSAAPGEPERFLAWLKAGGEPSAWVGDKPNVRAIVVMPAGEVFLYEDSVWPSGPITCDDFVVLGSGQEFASGALHMGATAAQAVEAAIRFDCNSGAPVRVLTREL